MRLSLSFGGLPSLSGRALPQVDPQRIRLGVVGQRGGAEVAPEARRAAGACGAPAAASGRAFAKTVRS
jgi:hypothetical protein